MKEHSSVCVSSERTVLGVVGVDGSSSCGSVEHYWRKADCSKFLIQVICTGWVFYAQQPLFVINSWAHVNARKNRKVSVQYHVILWIIYFNPS